MDTTAPGDIAIKKIPTARQVGVVLRAAGFKASQSHATCIRGFRNHTPGYPTRVYMPVRDCPVVSHVSGSGYSTADLAQYLDRYEFALRARFTVERREDSIVVTGFAP